MKSERVQKQFQKDNWSSTKLGGNYICVIILYIYSEYNYNKKDKN